MITTCVILNYNDSDTTISLLNKIKDYKNLDYIVVVDNLSSDNSYMLLKKYENNKIRVIQSDKNGGYGYGNNYGIRYSYNELNATHILIANPDVEFEDDCIYQLKQIIDTHKECAVVAARENNIRGYNAWKYTNALNDILSASILFNRLIKARYYPDTYFENKEFCYVDAVGGPMLMVNAHIMIEYGMYDEEMFLYEEEKTLGYKFKQNGYKTILLLTENFDHNHSVSIDKTFKSGAKKKQLLINSRIIFLQKYRNIKGFPLLCAKVFFKFTIAEIFIYSNLKKVINFFINKNKH